MTASGTALTPLQRLTESGVSLLVQALLLGILFGHSPAGRARGLKMAQNEPGRPGPRA